MMLAQGSRFWLRPRLRLWVRTMTTPTFVRRCTLHNDSSPFSPRSSPAWRPFTVVGSNTYPFFCRSSSHVMFPESRPSDIALSGVRKSQVKNVYSATRSDPRFRDPGRKPTDSMSASLIQVHGSKTTFGRPVDCVYLLSCDGGWSFGSVNVGRAACVAVEPAAVPEPAGSALSDSVDGLHADAASATRTQHVIVTAFMSCLPSNRAQCCCVELVRLGKDSRSLQVSICHLPCCRLQLLENLPRCCRFVRETSLQLQSRVQCPKPMNILQAPSVVRPRATHRREPQICLSHFPSSIRLHRQLPRRRRTPQLRRSIPTDSH